MQNYSEIHFKWLGKQVSCPDENLLNKNYKFYSECEIDSIKYEVGIGAVVRIESKPYIGVIHYFYEISLFLPNIKRHIVAIELFHKVKDIKTDLAKRVELDNDLEVVKNDKVTLVHLPVYAIKSRCLVVYGLNDEDPQELLHEFLTTTADTIYVCRYIASLKNGLYYLRAAICNEDDKKKTNNSTIEISEEEQSPNKHLTAGNFSVAHVENIASNIKIKLKRELDSPEKNTDDRQITVSPKQKKHVPCILAKKNHQSPSELLKNLTLSPKKHREILSVEQVKIINQNINRELVSSSSDEDVLKTKNLRPVVVLNKIGMDIDSPNVKRNRMVQTRRSSCVKSIDDETKSCLTPTRYSKRQTPKVSYTEYVYENKNKGSAKKSSRKQNLAEDTRRKSAITFEEVSPDKKIEDKEPKSARKKLVLEEKQSTVLDTPKRTRKQSVSFEDGTPVRQKRSVAASSDVTPKKQSRIMNTPRSGRLNIMTMTPTIEEREEPIVFCNTPMSRARMGLSAYSVPSKMPCRENEYTNIYSFVTGRLMDQSSGCMYISGVPGTGKTMTVCRVMSDLSDQKDDFSDFEFLKLNALALTEPRQIYVEIAKKLFNKKLHWEESLKEIERFFKAKKRKIPHVILVDELDKLCNRKQDVVYNLLDLPFHSVTPLIVITIANTMDLPERILTNKVNSRLGLIRLTFKPYQYKDLVKIVTERLATDAVFKNEALELVARKVAAVSGDARRALAMCARATEIAEEEDKDLVTMDVVDRVIKEMSSSSKVQAIQCCSRLEQLVLSAIANEVTRTGNEEVPFLNMLHNLEKLSLLESFKLPSAELCLRACHNLGSFRLLITQHGRIDINMTLMLNISTDDVHYALRN